MEIEENITTVIAQLRKTPSYSVHTTFMTEKTSNSDSPSTIF